ncbi:MAG: tRNA pseudouridine(55) synthase TruB [Enterocloster asparagiformis]|nr:tRNA pseudouridine(55) synthase TruB [Enterocloster asparagiformis]
MINGLINVYKEPGYTSHDVVARLRGILKQKKIGHTGTLDPAAQGVLPVCLGSATKLCDMLTDRTKTYRAVLLLGRDTDTQDTTGLTLSSDEAGAMALDAEQVRQAVMGFLGDYDQIPPMYSALKVDGKKLYELARAGKEVERRARPVKIHAIEVESVTLPRVVMSVTCSKGTYIRTLCYDIGRKLGCGGCMEQLTRTRVGSFELADSLKLDEIESLARAGEIEPYILGVEEVLADYPPVHAKPEADNLARNGNPLFRNQVQESIRPEEGHCFRLYDSETHFIGIYEYRSDKRWFKPQKMFLS